MDVSVKTESDTVPTPDTAPSSQESEESKMEVDEPGEEALKDEEATSQVSDAPTAEPEPDEQETKTEIKEKPQTVVETEGADKDAEETGCYWYEASTYLYYICICFTW